MPATPGDFYIATREFVGSGSRVVLYHNDSDGNYIEEIEIDLVLTGTWTARAIRSYCGKIYVWGRRTSIPRTLKLWEYNPQTDTVTMLYDLTGNVYGDDTTLNQNLAIDRTGIYVVVQAGGGLGQLAVHKLSHSGVFQWRKVIDVQTNLPGAIPYGAAVKVGSNLYVTTALGASSNNFDGVMVADISQAAPIATLYWTITSGFDTPTNPEFFGPYDIVAIDGQIIVPVSGNSLTPTIENSSVGMNHGLSDLQYRSGNISGLEYYDEGFYMDLSPDGAHIWISSLVIGFNVYKFDRTTGTLLDTIEFHTSTGLVSNVFAIYRTSPCPSRIAQVTLVGAT